MINETKYVVISESDYEWLRDKAKDKCTSTYSRLRFHQMDTIPAQELWDAAQFQFHIEELAEKQSVNRDKVTLTDFLTSNFPNND